MSQPITNVSGDPRHIVAAMGVVINRTGCILLVKTQRGHWEPPGGQVECGEDIATALKREIYEESGCRVEVGRLVGIYSNVGSPEQVILGFWCTHTRGEPQAGEECQEAGWFAPETALRMVTHPAQLGRLSDALQSHQHIVYRAYRTRPAKGDYYAGYEIVSERQI